VIIAFPTPPGIIMFEGLVKEIDLSIGCGSSYNCANEEKLKSLFAMSFT
jgi:hypothetical protein